MMQIHVHVADSSLNDDESIILETLISDLLLEIFGDFIEVEMFPRAEETKILFPDGAGSLTSKAAGILTASAVETIDKEIELAGLPRFSITVTHGDAPPYTMQQSYHQTRQRYPWMQAILPAVKEEAYDFRLEWTGGLTKITIH